MFRKTCVAALLAASLISNAGKAAVDGAFYAVVDTAYDGSAGGVSSYIRFYNGASTASTFSVLVIGSQTGKTYGQPSSLLVPSNASLQYGVGDLLALAAAPQGAGAVNGDTSYSIYIQNPDGAAGYQHVVYNSATKYFANASICENGLLTAATLARNNNLALINVHTTSLAGGALPSLITLHNDSSAAVTAKITVIDAGSTTSVTAGTVAGATTVAIPANSTVYKQFADLQTAVSWTTNAKQGYANVIVSDPTGAVPSLVVGHTIRNSVLGEDLNMTTACAVNNPTVASTYHGTIAGTALQSGTLAATLQPVVAHASSTVAKQSVFEKSQSVDRARAVAQTSAKLLLTDGTTVALAGTFDSATNAVTLSGSGYTFTGTAAAGVYSGTYTGPNNVSGGFSTLSTTQGAVTAYCGTYHENRNTPPGGGTPTADGVFNVQIAANGAVSGDTTPNSPSDGGPGTFTGQSHGVTVNLHHTATNKVGNDDDIVATVQNGVISGSYPAGDSGGVGTFSGGTCALPSS